MSLYEPIKQKVEGESEGDKLLFPEASKEIDLADRHSEESDWRQGRRRLRPCNIFEVGLISLIFASNLLWFVSAQLWGVQPTLRELDYCKCIEQISTLSANN